MGRREGQVIAAMATTRESEVLRDHADHMVEMEDMFGNPKKEWRNPLVLCGNIPFLLLQFCLIFFMGVFSSLKNVPRRLYTLVSAISVGWTRQRVIFSIRDLRGANSFCLMQIVCQLISYEFLSHRIRVACPSLCSQFLGGGYQCSRKCCAHTIFM